MCCAIDVAALLPLLAILAYLTADQSCSWLVANLVVDLAAINLAVLLIDLAVLSIDLAVLCIQSRCASVVAGHSCSSSCWPVLFLATHQSCC
jgi:hypothetical protein